ncbi:putative leucine-rich repeat-containing protein DDB_G0290503 [Ptychodera flava]|uniref:putative leucine-rich repeat-containing protein DDB_G0290503 n=1 Tax=Ptychodera flava TaxID=63121 RepID=UPI003969D4B5
MLQAKLAQVILDKSFLDKQNQETLEELEIQDLEATLSESDDLVTNLQELLSVEESKLKESRDLVTMMQAKLDQVILEKSFLDKQNQETLEELDKQNQETLEELGKAKKVESENAIEVTSLKKKIQDLEATLSESDDLVTNLQELLSVEESKLKESRDLVTMMQAKLDQVILEKSFLDKQNQETLEELVEESKLKESRDLVTTLQAQLEDAEKDVTESKNLVMEMQVKLSDAEIRAIESNTIKGEFDNAPKEIAYMKAQLNKAMKLVTQLEDQLEIVVQEKSAIQES